MQSKTNGIFKEIVSYIFYVLIVYLLINFLVDKTEIMSGSMEPTLNTGDIVFFLNDSVTGLHRSDIIEFNGHGEEEGKVLCKRIIGMPGDTISFDGDGGILIDGVPVAEEYIDGEITYAYTRDSYAVPEDCYFVMGDNREDSFDSRYWSDPFVKQQDILGTYWFRIPKR